MLTIGAITGFIASAFVTPTDANFQTLHAMAKDEVRTRTVGSLFNGVILNSADAEKAAKILKAAASDPTLKAAAEKVVGNTDSLARVGETVTVLTSVSSTKKIARSAVNTALSSVRTHRISHEWKEFKKAAHPFTQEQMDRIEWALKKKDVRRCDDVRIAAHDEQRKQAIPHSPGDYLALCIAVVTGDSLRCHQILWSEVQSIRSLCSDELATI